MEPTLENATMMWDALGERVETFLEAWEATRRPPAMGEHLPADPPALRMLTLVELIKVDLEFRWKENAPKTVEEYAAEFPELNGECGPPADLIYEEFHVRRGAGENVSVEDYFQRFPQQESRLRRLMGIGDPQASSALYSRRGAPELAVGDSIDDFLILAVLGKGSFASVYLAQQKSMQRRVALKVSLAKGQEAQTLAQLDHNNIVRVFDQRVLPQEDLCLLYMQFVAGGTLSDTVDRLRVLPLRERSGKELLRAVDGVLHQRGENSPGGSIHRNELEMATWPIAVCQIGCQLAYALSYAHAQGVLHRDIKPANVLMGADGSPMLADFNISFASQLDGATPAAFFGGSLAYMSPEQLDASNPACDVSPDSLDGRSDIYSLGVLLWELLYGRRPWPNEEMGSDWSGTLDKFARTRREVRPKPPETDARDRVLRELHEVLEKCLAPFPEDRFADASDLGRELKLCTQPRTQMLLKLPHQGWRSIARRWPIPTFMIAVLTPHVFAAVFNFVYNKSVIIDEVARTHPQTVVRFQVLAGWINGTFFPIGLAILLWLVWPVHRALVGQPRGGREAEPAPPVNYLSIGRRRSLLLPIFAATIGMALWLLAGMAYPMFLPLSWNQSIHFVLSLLVCGLIAGCYPFFGTAYVVVRVFYPALLVAGAADVDEEKRLQRLVRETGLVLLTTVAVPLVGGFMLYLGQKFGLQNWLVDVALGLLFGLGFIGIFVAFFMYQRIRDDAEALVEAARPTETHAVRSTPTISRKAE